MAETPSAAAPPALFHDRAVIVSTGDELMTGQLQDSNARWLSEQLIAAAILPVEHVAVGDSLPDLAGTLRRAAERAPLVIMSGGLGPTDGDLTRAALAEILDEPLVVDEDAKAAITDMLTRRGRAVTERQLRQAQRPRSAACLANAMGTAPGLHARIQARTTAPPLCFTDVFALPGPPGELRPMFERGVLPLLRPRPGHAVVTRLLHLVGLAEADCVQMLGDLTRRDRNPLVGITASGGVLTIRIRFAGSGDAAQARLAVDVTEASIRKVLTDHVLDPGPAFLTDGGSQAGQTALAQSVLTSLRACGQTLCTVESCTGGLLGEMLTRIPGSSAAYIGGYVTYSNELKARLGISRETLTAHGAVSAPVAEQMARAGLQASGAMHSLAITGIAGPDGGSAAKPVGTVHIALASGETAPAPSPTVSIDGRLFRFTGDREDIRRRAAASALAMLHFRLRGHAPGSVRLLWEERT